MRPDATDSVDVCRFATKRYSKCHIALTGYASSVNGVHEHAIDKWCHHRPHYFEQFTATVSVHHYIFICSYNRNDLAANQAAAAGCCSKAVARRETAPHDKSASPQQDTLQDLFPEETAPHDKSARIQDALQYLLPEEIAPTTIG